ncbi:MAG: fatty acid CoA ligase family protein [Myxococcota bacterium]
MTATIESSPKVDATTASLNIADRMRQQAQLRGTARAVVVPESYDARGRRCYAHLTFAQLDHAIDRYAAGLASLGVKPGMRCLLMVKPSLEFFGLTFALFRLGAVPVLIDPAMGRTNVLGAIGEVAPEAFIAIPRGHVARLMFGRSFQSVKINVTVGSRWFWGGVTLDDVEALGAKEEVPEVHTTAADTAAILFTSGSTGAPKGVLYTHGIFDAQVRIFEDDFKIEPGEVDLSAFPLFSLFSAALGVTVVVPDMDATKPAFVDGAKICEAIEDQGVTYAFGSPAFWHRVTTYCEDNDVTLPSLRRVLMAGAPCPVTLLERVLKRVSSTADAFTPYGATECLPITLPSARKLVASGASAQTSAGRGTYVGAPIANTEVKIIAIRDEPIARLADAEVLPAGEIGEIVVRSEVTTQGYFQRPDDDARSKVSDGSAHLWHRMGDVGYLDDQGQLWFCGRKSHRLETSEGPMFTVCCEAIFNQHDRVYRSALVGLGDRGQQRPVIIVECTPEGRTTGKGDEATLRAELLALAKTSPLTASIETVLFHDAFPVDARHNAKIRREDLTVWAKGVV